MPLNDKLLQEFHALFGENGGDQLPGNVGISRTVVNVCQELMKVKDPILFDYFKQWDSRKEHEPFGIEQLLARRG